MAYDTVIDKAQLEGAITASANAIREKTGDTALIEWMSDKGFAEAIATIETGSDAGDSEMEEQWAAAIERNENKPVTKIPAGITSIGNHAFRECTNMALTELPAGITSIGEYAFYRCFDLAITSLPASLTSIKKNAFQNCGNLAITSIPAGVARIEASAFQSCGNLEKITFEGKPNYLHNLAFYYCANIHTINVPWAEGEIAEAPWGATNATINYNYTGG